MTKHAATAKEKAEARAAAEHTLDDLISPPPAAIEGAESVAPKGRASTADAQEGASHPVRELAEPGEGWEPVHTSTSTTGEWARYTRQRQVGSGTVLQTETIVRNPDGSYALSQATVFVPR